MRRVTTYSTLGGNEKTISTEATIWSQLQRDLSSNGVNFSGMKAVIGETQVTLESGEAQLPDGDFTLFLTAQKVKSGSEDDDDDDYDFDEEEDEHYDTDEEAGLISVDGINWDDVDWNEPEESIENHCFKSAKDLAIARAKKSIAYLNNLVDYLEKEARDRDSTPNAKAKELREMAQKIQRNIEKSAGLFD